MIGVVVPAHDEEALIGACIDALHAASQNPRLGGEIVRIVVVCDACSDATEPIARTHGANVLCIAERNVGLARAAGARACIEAGARWLAFTDADTRVSSGWLVSQLALGAEVVCGTVSVLDWESYGERMRKHFERVYTDADGHRHIHGANLGICASAYRNAGGFDALVSSEDVAIVGSLLAAGATVAWSASPRVVTSARRDFRAPGGFGATLAAVASADERNGAVLLAQTASSDSTMRGAAPATNQKKNALGVQRAAEERWRRLIAHPRSVVYDDRRTRVLSAKKYLPEFD